MISEKHAHRVVQDWIREDEEEASTVIMIALHCKCGSGYTEELEDEDNAEESEDSDEPQGGQQIQQNKLKAICKWGEEHEDEYIKFISKFGPAMAGVFYWNNYKSKMVLSELLTVTNEAFIHLCMINYSSSREKKNGENE